MRHFTTKWMCIIAAAVALLFVIQPVAGQAKTHQRAEVFKNGSEWLDTAGNPIQAHGGGFMKYNGYYYWVGENRATDHTNGVNLYRSKNLHDWTYVNHILSTEYNPQLTGQSIERPKLIYNEKTKTFVLWAHWENGLNYSSSHLLVATSKTVGGNYTVIRNSRPGAGEVADPSVDPTYTGNDGKYGYGSRDFTIYKDPDSDAAYLVSAQNSSNMRLYRLTDDYTNVDWQTSYPLFAGKHREAPALIKKDGTYFLITSSQSGWSPNQAMVSYTKNIADPNSWSDLRPIGNNSTFYTQPTGILQIGSGKHSQYIYQGDRWNTEALGQSRYIWLPLTFNKTDVQMTYQPEWWLDHRQQIRTPKTALLSQGKPVTATAATGGETGAEKANDGIYSQELQWSPSNAYIPGTVPYEWSVDLGRLKKLSRVDISFVSYNGSEAYSQYQVFASNDQKNWDLISDQSANTTTSFQSIPVNTAKPYRYVKVTVSKVVNEHNGNAAAWAAGLTEVQVYGQAHGLIHAK